MAALCNRTRPTEGGTAIKSRQRSAPAHHSAPVPRARGGRGGLPGRLLLQGALSRSSGLR